MPSLGQYNDLTQWKILPFVHIILYLQNGDSYTFNELENGSQLTINPVTRNDSRGGERVVAWKVEFEAKIIQNNFGDMTSVFENITKGNIKNVTFGLIASGLKQANGENMQIGGPTEPEVTHANWSVNHRIEQGDDSPALTIYGKGLYSPDAIYLNDVNNKFIYQLWSSS